LAHGNRFPLKSTQKSSFIMQNIRLASALTLLALPFLAQAQSPVSGFMNGKGHGAIAVSYNAEKYDDVFLVPDDAKGVPVFNEVAVNSTSLYASYGISDRFDAVVSRSGVQDLSVFLKYNPYNCQIGTNDLRFMLGAGVKTPLSDYRADEGLQSIIAIGNRATSVTGLAIAHLRCEGGVFLTTQAGYSVRNGEVPNALLGEIKAGYAGRHIYVDVWFAGQVSDGGVNILGEGFTGFFPATDVSYSRTGLNVYVPIAGGFGISGGVSHYLEGRNVGKSTGVSGSVVYSF
jgi:hypothetical protein